MFGPPWDPLLHRKSSWWRRCSAEASSNLISCVPYSTTVDAACSAPELWVVQGRGPCESGHRRYDAGTSVFPDAPPAYPLAHVRGSSGHLVVWSGRTCGASRWTTQHPLTVISPAMHGFFWIPAASRTTLGFCVIYAPPSCAVYPIVANSSCARAQTHKNTRARACGRSQYSTTHMHAVLAPRHGLGRDHKPNHPRARRSSMHLSGLPSVVTHTLRRSLALAPCTLNHKS